MSNVLPLQDKISVSSDENTEIRLLITDFGDGYQQRSAAGINNTRKTLSIVHEFLDSTDSATLRSFYQSKTAGQIITVTGPFDSTSRNYFLEGFSETATQGGSLRTFTANLRQVFDT